MSNLMNIDGNLNLPKDGDELTNLALVSQGAGSSKRRRGSVNAATTEANTEWDAKEDAALHYGCSIGLRAHGIVNNDLLGHILKLRSKKSIEQKIYRLPKDIKEKISNKEEFPKPEVDGPFEPHPDKDQPKKKALLLDQPVQPIHQPVQIIQQTNQAVQPDLFGFIKSGFESIEIKIGMQSVSLGDDLKAMGSALEQKIDKEIGAVETRIVSRVEGKIEKEIGAVETRIVSRVEGKIEEEIGAVVPRLGRIEVKLDGVVSHVHPRLEQMQSQLRVIESGVLPPLSPLDDDALPPLPPLDDNVQQ